MSFYLDYYFLDRLVKRKVIEFFGFILFKVKRKSGVGYLDLKIKRMI